MVGTISNRPLYSGPAGLLEDAKESQVDFPGADLFDQANLPESAPGKLKSIE